MAGKKKCRFFISHSSQDIKLVRLFVDDILVKGLKIDDEEIYCSSMQGLGNLSGRDFIEEIKNALENAEVSFLIISENYKASEICLNEMGAAWLSKSYVIPILVSPINFKTVGALNVQKHCEKMLVDDSLYNIRATVEQHATILPTKPERWKNIVENFLEAAKKVKLPPATTVSFEVYQNLLKDKKSLEEEFQEISKEIDIKDNYIKKLESKKDKAAVKAVKKEVGLIGYEEEFEEKISAVKKALKPFNSITTKLLLCNFYHHDHPNLEGYWDDIKDSQRKKFLTEDCESGAKTANTNLEEALEEVGVLGNDSDFCEWFSDEHKEEFDPSDEEFWDKFY